MTWGILVWLVALVFLTCSVLWNAWELRQHRKLGGSLDVLDKHLKLFQEFQDNVTLVMQFNADVELQLKRMENGLRYVSAIVDRINEIREAKEKLDEFNRTY